MKKNNRPVLTIGMIVKNEEENLARCLESLRPLREAIPCQLIITDTGSTDRTMEIARQYGDEVEEFQWCNDFAAARNSALDKAQGEWFMFIDADEYLDNADELIHFFQSGIYRKYQNANYYVRNYRSLGRQDVYMDSRAARLFRCHRDRRFEGNIHEFIRIEPENYDLKQTLAHHYGYAVNHDAAFQEKKKERNIRLLEKELAENSENPRVLMLCADSYIKWGEPERYCTVVHKGYRLVKGDNQHLYYPVFTRMEAKALWLEGKKGESIQLMEDYFSSKVQPYAFDIDIAYQLGTYYYELEQYEKSLSWLNRYDQLVHLPRDKAFVGNFTAFSNLIFASETFIQAALSLRSICTMQLGELEQAADYLGQIELEKYADEVWNYYIMPLTYVLLKTGRLEQLCAAYENILQLRTAEEIAQVEQLIEDHLQQGVMDRQTVAEAFSAYFRQSKLVSNYVQLQRARLLLEGKEKQDEQALAAVDYFRKQPSPLPIHYGDVLLACCLRGLAFAPFLQKIPLKLYPEYVRSVQRSLTGDDTVAFVQAMQEQKEKVHRVQEAYFLACLLENVILRNVQPQQPVHEMILQLYEAYLQLGWQYVVQCYRGEMLTADRIQLLPQVCRFFYYQHQASEAQEQGNWTGYRGNIRLATEAYPIMGQLVSAQLEQMERQLEEQKNVQDEFAQAAIQVKENILGLLHMGQLAEAKELLQLYIEINGKDTDGITMLRNKVIAATADTSGL